jgi:molecular chaperone GrpE
VSESEHSEQLTQPDPEPSEAESPVNDASAANAEDTLPLDENDLAEEELTFEELLAENERLRMEADEYLEGWQRARAEFANFKKRVGREQEEMRGRVVAEFIAQYLDVLDDLERALRDHPKEQSNHSWIEGVEMIYQKFRALVDAEGIEVIDAEGETFDPNLHEAISYEESEDHRDGQVIEVIKQGYRLGERIVRPAFVRVAK